MGHRICGQPGDQIVIFDAPIHTANQDRTDLGNAFKCLYGCISDGGNGVVVVAYMISLTDKGQTMGQRFIGFKGGFKFFIRQTKHMAECIVKGDVDVVMVTQKMDFSGGNPIFSGFKTDLGTA